MLRLQSKKTMPASRLPYNIVLVFALSLAYWSYLALTTRMEIVFDSIGYQDFGRMIHTQGWVAYFQTGPNREPVYPWMVALSMGISDHTGMAYERVMAWFGVGIMFLTQVLAYNILRLCKIRDAVIIGVLSYFAVSPALNNAAFSLYSEIAALPIILGIVLAAYAAWQKPSFGRGALLGVLLAAATFVKAPFECIAPVYLLIFFISVMARGRKEHSHLLPFVLCAVSSLIFFYGPVIGYKALNKHYNGNFVVTSRGSWALYGNTTRRMEPLTVERFGAALAYAGGEGLCASRFSAQDCNFWSYRLSDQLGMAKYAQLTQRHLPSEKINATLINLSAQTALSNPFQYALLTTVEGLKMFFWESTKIGFVDYPPWLQKIYNIKIFNNGLRFLLFTLSFVSVLSLWKDTLTGRAPPAGFLMGTLIFLYILFFSFFFILTRYALPMASLYLISIGIWINKKL